MPERFLLQILRNLVTHGILRSTRGVDGGYSLVRPAHEVSLLEVIEAIEGPLNTGEPITEGMSIESQNRLLSALQQVTDNSRRQLEAVKLSQLLEPPTLPTEPSSTEPSSTEPSSTEPSSTEPSPTEPSPPEPS